MQWSGAPHLILAEAVQYSAHIRNRISPMKQNLSPYDIIFKQKPVVSHIKIFGSKTYVYIPDCKRKKWGEKAYTGTLHTDQLQGCHKLT